MRIIKEVVTIEDIIKILKSVQISLARKGKDDNYLKVLYATENLKELSKSL